MPSYVLADKCDGCKALDKTACQYVCPNDLMVLDPKQMKAFNQEPDMCWECYCCVKICPVQAIEVRGYADFMPLGAMVTPLRVDRFDHVDPEVPQWHAEAVQVPDSHHGGREGGAVRPIPDGR